MPIGKDSIKTRVAKVSATEPVAESPAQGTAPASEAKPAAPKKPAAPRKPAAPKAEGADAPKAPAKKKPAAPKAEKPVEAPAEPRTEPAAAVLANVAPETVEAVIGHKEEQVSDKVQVGQKMPHYLL